MADSFQNEVPKARINLKLDLHTGGASKKMELPLKLLVAGDFSNGQESAQISEREKVNITKNNFDSVLSEYSPKLNLTVKNTLSDDGGEENVQLTFQSMKDFTPEQVAAQIYMDFLVMLRVYLGWRFKARITLTTSVRLLAVPPLGENPFWLGMNGVLGAEDDSHPDDIPETFTTELGYYSGLEPAKTQQGNRRVTYKFN
jgi:type VI secretion system protein ImpB